MDPIVLQGSVHRFNGDHLGEATITFKIPNSAKPAAFEVGQLTEEPLIITVMRERDFHALRKGGNHANTHAGDSAGDSGDGRKRTSPKRAKRSATGHRAE